MTQTPKWAAAIEAMARAKAKDFDVPGRDDWEIFIPSATLDLEALLAALPALGWQLVPVVATERMLDAGGKNANVQTDRGPGGSGGIYADMLAAAPKFGGAE